MRSDFRAKLKPERNSLLQSDRARDERFVGIPCWSATPGQVLDWAKGGHWYVFSETGSPTHLRWLEVFEPLMVIAGIVKPLATLPSITKL